LKYSTSLVFALILTCPVAAIAEPSQSLTREQVRQEMIEYEAAGFNPARQNPRTWVDDAQAASIKVGTARMAQQRSSQLAATNDSGECK
jgi:hypothetical protein